MVDLVGRVVGAGHVLCGQNLWEGHGEVEAPVGILIPTLATLDDAGHVVRQACRAKPPAPRLSGEGGVEQGLIRGF